MLTIITFIFYFTYFVLRKEVNSAACPGPNVGSGAQWVACAGYSGQCRIPNGISQGFISYGLNSHWILIPFSNYGRKDLIVTCNDDFGDVFPEVDHDDISPECCYTNILDMNNQFGKLKFPVNDHFDLDETKKLHELSAQVIPYHLPIELQNEGLISIGSTFYNIYEGGDTLERKAIMTAGKAMLSLDKQWALVIELDGELALYRTSDAVKLWSAPGSYRSGENNYLIYDENGDGNLLLRGENNTLNWQSYTASWDRTPGRVIMQNDGQFTIRDSTGLQIWDSFANANNINQPYFTKRTNAPTIIRYGNNDRYIYRAYSNVEVKCNHLLGFSQISTETDEDNECQFAFDNPVNVTGRVGNILDWITCGYDGDQCRGLAQNTPHWIRYGSVFENKWEYQLIVSGDTSIQCNENVFHWDDLDLLTANLPNKICQRASSPQYIFSNIIGQWVMLQSCDGNCDGIEYTTSYGVHLEEEHEITHEWGISLTRTAKAGFKMFSASSKLEINYNVVSRTLTSKTLSTETTFTIKCSSGTNTLYQWVTSADEFGTENNQNVKIQSTYYLCSTSTISPDCAPGQCGTDAFA